MSSELMIAQPSGEIERVQLSQGDVVYMQRLPQSDAEKRRNFWRAFWGLTVSEPVNILLREKME